MTTDSEQQGAVQATLLCLALWEIFQTDASWRDEALAFASATASTQSPYPPTADEAHLPPRTLTESERSGFNEISMRAYAFVLQALDEDVAKAAELARNLCTLLADHRFDTLVKKLW